MLLHYTTLTTIDNDKKIFVMTGIFHEFTILFWLIFFCIIIGLVLIDLKVSNGNNQKSSMIVSFICIGASLLFCLYLYLYYEKHFAIEFITGYIIELSLSVDNIFIFIIIFDRFKVSHNMQHRILFYGIMGAMVMRLIMIIVGIELLSSINWIMYIFGGILIYAGAKIFLERNTLQKTQEKEKQLFSQIENQYHESQQKNCNVLSKSFLQSVINSIRKFITNIIPIYNEKSSTFFVSVNNKKMITTNFIVLLLIEKADLVFAIDSIPAVLAVTQEPFIVFTSNMFAIVGLRSFYFVLSKGINKFSYMKYGLAVILFFIGCKMILSVHGVHISNSISLILITTIITFSVYFSIYVNRLSIVKTKE